jgi:hypothetical protein
MEMPDLLLWLGVAATYAFLAVGVQRLFIRFMRPFKNCTRSAAELA